MKLILGSVHFALPIAFFFLLQFIGGVHTLKILVYSPTIGHSHVNFLGKIADTLLDAGHQVLMYVPIMDPDVQTNGTNRVEVLRRHVMEEDQRFYDLWKNSPMKTTPFAEDANMMDEENMAIFVGMMVKLCEAQIADKDLMNLLSSYHFDVAITESYDYCSFGIFKLANIPAHVIASAVPFMETLGDLFGVPQPPSYVPSVLGPFSDEMSYWQRIMNMYIGHVWRQLNANILARENELFRQHCDPAFPDLHSLAKKTALAFVNADELVEFPRPITHRIIYIGGIGLPKTNALPKPLERILSGAKRGAVLVSFGSIANSTLMPLEKKKELLKTMAAFPDFRFIWKYEEPERDAALFTNATNVHPIKWAPQMDLLNDVRVKAFVTHGGANSMTEALYAGTPTIAVPLFGDQEHNVAVAVKRGVCVSVDKTTLNAVPLIAALNRVLEDQTFSDRARRLSQMLRKKPLKPQELLVKYVEFAAEFRDFSSLDIAGRDFGYLKYFCLDIFLPIILLLLIALFVVVKVALLTVRKVAAIVHIKSKLE